MKFVIDVNGDFTVLKFIKFSGESFSLDLNEHQACALLSVIDAFLYNDKDEYVDGVVKC